ncbi:hypothetical protein GCM10028808_10530 [Spirosoma migulaei]
MAYINLKLIGELVEEASTNYGMLQSTGYRADKTDPLPDDTFVTIVKTHWQAENLLEKLTCLHQVCSDFSTGNFDFYIVAFNQLKESGDIEGEFDPFEELEICFGGQSVDDLPRQIEQYLELLCFSRSFASIQQQKRAANRHLYRKLPLYYPTKNEAGETVMIKTSDLPESFCHQQAVNREITEVEIEHCLDRYNEFYTHATGLLSAFPDGDIQGCAEAILSLFSLPK